jgi:DNA polymerase I-like protein with 3'-5' exonuclease and polymerase domains
LVKITPRKPKLLSKDSETTGLDFKHGTQAFFLTTCNELGEQAYWEGEVEPTTREVTWLEEDLREIGEYCNGYDTWIYQNSKFDVKAERSIGIEHPDKVWSRIEDTLIQAHLVASNQPKNLTALALVHLGVNIQPYEERIKKACNEARRMARSEFPDWRIAKKGLPEMPSVKDKCASADMWLPRAIAKEKNYPDDHPWWRVLEEYSNADSAVTLPIFLRLREIIEQRGLVEIYRERLKLLPVAYEMEEYGVTISKTRLDELKVRFKEESERAGRICTNIAKSYGYDLELPKSGNNKSLVGFCFGVTEEIDTTVTPVSSHEIFKGNGLALSPEGIVTKTTQYLGLEPITRSKKTGEPSLDKEVLEHYTAVLSPNSKQLTFVKSLRGKRQRDTASNYMMGYRNFWKPVEGEEDWYRLFPSLNATGTDTLRWSSSNPNSQNISKQEDFTLRYCFGPAPGRIWYSLDYENVELRLPAFESNERIMIELFEKPDDPPFFGSYHLMNASIIYPDLFWPLAEKKGEFKKKYASTWYQWVKNFGFSIAYGAQEAKADATAKRAGSYKAVKERLKEHSKLNQSLINFANKHGYVETIPDKTVNPKRGYPIYCSRSNYGSISPTLPLNYHIQSSAMWATAKAMVRVSEYLKTLPDHHMVLQVHDEIVVDFPDNEEENVAIIDKVQSLMELSGDDFGIPLKVAVTCHKENWAKGD